MSDQFEFVKKLGPKKLMIIGVIGAGILVGLIALALSNSGASLTPIYTNLALEDTQRIVTELESQGISYAIGGNGTQVMVQGDKVMKLRLQFAEMGLPANEGASLGYEIFDKEERLGTSSFVQNMNQLRALEGELGRTIAEIQEIKSARVHLVMPKQQLFKKEDYKPTASIQLSMKGGSTLKSSEVAAIRYLVASAVPGLSVDAVTVIDNHGTLLARGGESDDAGIYASNSSEYKANYEKKMQSKIVELLEKSFGMGNIRAQVTADIDFDRVVTNSEIYDPEGQVVRSVQSTEEKEASGVGGQGGEVSVANNLPGGAAAGSAGAGGGDNRQRVDEVTNYEISKTIKNHISESGKVNKLSIAVLVDGIYTENPETGVFEYKERSKEELAKLDEMIRSSVGFDQKRGDTLTVTNMQFSPEFSGFKSESMIDWIKEDLESIIQSMVMGLVAMLVILMVVRPLVKRAIEINAAQQGVLPEGGETFALLPAPYGAAAGAPGTPQIAGTAGGGGGAGEYAPAGQDAGGEGGFSILDGIQSKNKPSSVKQINELIASNPQDALAALRGWMYGEATA